MIESVGSLIHQAATIRADFPILCQPARESRPAVAFLDNASTTQKPQSVIDTISDFYQRYNANIHRGIYELSEAATNAFEGVRKQAAQFINAASPREIVFVRNTTEAINLVAQSWGRANLKAGDRIALTAMEHHSNIVPWQLIAEERGAELVVIQVTPEGRLDPGSFELAMAKQPKLLALTHVSNAVGVANPVASLIARAHAAGALVLIDGAQSAPHMPVDVQDLDCDFFAFSGHKMLGPTGVGVLYGKKHLLDSMPPFMTGGSMIRKVTLEKSTWADTPNKFEAGTPAIGDVIGFGAALTYLEAIGMEHIRELEQALGEYLLEALKRVPGLTVVGPDIMEDRTAVVSFTIDGLHPHDVASILDEDNVAVRAGHHCAQPLLEMLEVFTTTRASAYIYNTTDDIDRLATSLDRAYRVFHQGR
jgi:cysteine desulfurase/selenocysteine lyase